MRSMGKIRMGDRINGVGIQLADSPLQRHLLWASFLIVCLSGYLSATPGEFKLS